jgi:predicted nucleic acid-binding protein
MITSETALLDTNVLVYAADETSPFHPPSKHLRDNGLRGKVSLCVFPQIFSEFFAVITDSRRVSNPRTQEEAATEIEKYLQAEYLLKLFPGPDVMDIMLDLLRRYEVKRQEIFDLQLVATMLSNNIKRIYTFNREHFDRFAEIDTLEP